MARPDDTSSLSPSDAPASTTTLPATTTNAAAVAAAVATAVPDTATAATSLKTHSSFSETETASSPLHESSTEPIPSPAALAAAPSSGSRQNGDATPPKSPTTMSDHQHPHGFSRQPGSYPNPAGFGTNAAATTAAQYAYSIPSSQPPSDAFRSSSGVPVSLPSVKSFDPLQSQPQSQPQPLHHHLHHHQQQQQQQQQQHQQHISPVQHPINMPMSIPHAQSTPYYGHGSLGSNSYHMSSDPAAIRFAIPPHPDPRFGGPRGPKKEIKRRTKTGCLTCRKRRIKCDEGHPTCNNCKKSKRDCAGYDPIFKQQAGPSNIQQPLVNKHPIPSQIVPSSSTLVPPLSSSGMYGHQPAVLTSSYGPTGAPPSAFDPMPSTHAQAKSEGYDYPSSADSSLHHQTLPTLSSSKSPSASSSHQRFPVDNLHLRAQKMKVDQLISLLGPASTPQHVDLTDDLYREIVHVYHEIYVGALGAFFESAWFQTKDAQGLPSFPESKTAIGHFAAFLQVVRKTRGTDPASIVSGILETRLTWTLATLPYGLSAPGSNVPTSSLPDPGDSIEARNRVFVFDTLLSGEFLASNPLAPALADPQIFRTREFDFWHTLADYLCVQDEPHLSHAPRREEILSRLRLLLDGRENRDLLYSIAIARELAPRFEPGYETTMPPHLDESHPRSKLFVASDLIRKQAMPSGGTTCVVRRFSELAIQAFISPGVNIAKMSSTGLILPT